MAEFDLPETDDQDQSEMFDEDIMGDEGVGPSAEMRVFEELPDVYDVTSRQGDADVDDSLAAEDADEIEDEELDDIDLDDDDGEDDDSLDDEPEDNEVFTDEEDDADLDEVDGVDDLEADDVETVSVGDVDEASDADQVSDYESETELSDDDVEELGYAEEEEEEVDEQEDGNASTHGAGLVPSGPGKPAQGHSGEAADLAADRVHAQDLDELHAKDRQEVLLEEGLEETFPASDPVSVKRIT